MAGENLDLSSEPNPRGRTSEPRPGRRYIGVRFACCEVYARVYINREATAYQGNCPRCSKALSVRIDPGGTDSRFFTVY